MRWLGAGAALLLGSFLVMAAVGLLGGPMAPLLPWAHPPAQPRSGAVPGTHHHHQRNPAGRQPGDPAPDPTPRAQAGSQPRPPATSQPSPAGSLAGSPAGTAPTSAASSHVPPGQTRKPSAAPTKSHP